MRGDEKRRGEKRKREKFIWGELIYFLVSGCK